MSEHLEDLGPFRRALTNGLRIEIPVSIQLSLPREGMKVYYLGTVMSESAHDARQQIAAMLREAALQVEVPDE